MLASAVDQAVLRTFVDSRFPRVGAALDDAACPSPPSPARGSSRWTSITSVGSGVASVGRAPFEGAKGAVPNRARAHRRQRQAHRGGWAVRPADGVRRANAPAQFDGSGEFILILHGQFE